MRQVVVDTRLHCRFSTLEKSDINDLAHHPHSVIAGSNPGLAT
ncbi:hypothetical protein Pan54_31770 [Rubinisphaera italica]|uniref:Uncharacterized protein n=1 Tax=Rubinisphaera italica TaxID=2527969 RepID=A0A5C5XJY2_9PLAN|nr:hypothetical protein Pan54_31770 [Rubinisphaera italica]